MPQLRGLQSQVAMFGRFKEHHAWAEARRRAGLQQHVTIHGLRHSWVTRAAEFGSLEQIRRCTNHSAVTMTARYSHLAISDVLPLIVRVGEAIGGSDDA